MAYGTWKTEAAPERALTQAEAGYLLARAAQMRGMIALDPFGPAAPHERRDDGMTGVFLLAPCKDDTPAHMGLFPHENQARNWLDAAARNSRTRAEYVVMRVSSDGSTTMQVMRSVLKP